LIGVWYEILFLKVSVAKLKKKKKKLLETSALDNSHFMDRREAKP